MEEAESLKDIAGAGETNLSAMERLRHMEKLAKTKLKESGHQRKSRYRTRKAFGRSDSESTSLVKGTFRKSLTPSQVALLYETLQMSGPTPAPTLSTKTTPGLGLGLLRSDDFHEVGVAVYEDVHEHRHTDKNPHRVPGTALSSERLIMSHSFSGTFAGYSSDTLLINQMFVDHDVVVYSYAHSSDTLRRDVWNRSATVVQAAWRGYSTRRKLKDTLNNFEAKPLVSKTIIEDISMSENDSEDSLQRTLNTKTRHDKLKPSSHNRIAKTKDVGFFPQSLSLTISDEDTLIRFFELIHGKQRDVRTNLKKIVKWLQRRVLQRCNAIHQKDVAVRTKVKELIDALQEPHFDIERELSMDQFVDLVTFGFLVKGGTRVDKYFRIDIRKKILVVASLLLSHGTNSIAEGIVGASNVKKNPKDRTNLVELFHYIDNNGEGMIVSRTLAAELRRLGSFRLTAKDVKRIIAKLNFNVYLEDFLSFVDEEKANESDLARDIFQIAGKVATIVNEVPAMTRDNERNLKQIRGEEHDIGRNQNGMDCTFQNQGRFHACEEGMRAQDVKLFEPEMFHHSLKAPAARIASGYYYKP